MRKAFTLLEIVLVVAVLGILASAVVPYAGGVYRRAQISGALAHARLIEAAKDSYAMSNPGVYGTISESELEPYMPKGVALSKKTPFGSEYQNILNLDKPVSFTCGGKTYSSLSDEI